MTPYTTSHAKQATLSPASNAAGPFSPERTCDSEPLLARTLSGVFDQSFDLYKRHFKTLALIAALLFFPTQIVLHGVYNTWLRPLEAHLQTSTVEADVTGVLATLVGGVLIGNPEYGLPGILSLCMLALVSGPLCVAVSDILLGRIPSVKESYRRAASSMPRLLLGWTFAALTSFGIAAGCGFAVFFVALFVGIALGSELGPGVMIVVWFIGLVTTYLLSAAAVARFAIFTSPLVTLEGRSLLSVYERNQQLVGRLRFRHTWAAAAALPIVVFGLQYLILLSAYRTLDAFHLPPLNQFVINIALTAAIVLFFQPYLMVVITTLYYDYRVRGEGLDLILLATNLPLSAHAEMEAADGVAPPSRIETP